MIVVGLTGSIGMGKSTTAGLFARHGDAVHDADAAVHRLYGGAAVEPVRSAFPGVVVNGVVDRARLSAAVLEDPEAMKRLETIVHPMVREDEARFLGEARCARCRFAVLDIPLLLETGRDRDVDVVVVASASKADQRARVLARPGMTVDRFQTILSRQMSDAEKRRRAHFIIDTGESVSDAARQVAAVRRACMGLG